MDFDATQAIALSDFDDETDDEVPDDEKKPVAHLKVHSCVGFPETLFPVCEGVNLIGRNGSTCNLHIALKALSKQHACIEVTGDSHLIYDKGSCNKTKKGKLYLTPDVRYNLQHGDELTFADVKCSYFHANKQASGSGNTKMEGRSIENQAPENNNQAAARDAETMEYELDDDDDDDDDEPSSDILQPTQAYDPDGNGLLSRKVNMCEATQLYVAESDDENGELAAAEPVQSTSSSALVAKPGKKKVVAFAETQYVPDSDDSEDDNDAAKPSSNSNTNKVTSEEATMAYQMDFEEDTNDEGAAGSASAADDHLMDAATQAYAMMEEDEDTASKIKGKQESEAKQIVKDADGGTAVYDMDIESTQTSAEISKHQKYPKQTAVCSEYDDELATQTYGNSKEEGNTATQVFGDDGPGSSNPEFSLGANTLPFDFDSDGDESLILQKQPIKLVSNKSENVTCGTDATMAIDEVDWSGGNQKATAAAGEIRMQILSEVGDTVALPDTDSTQVLGETNDTVALPDTDSTQVLGETDATEVLGDDDATQILDQPETGSITKSISDDDQTQLLGDAAETDIETPAVMGENATTVVVETSLLQKGRTKPSILSPIEKEKTNILNASGDDMEATQLFNEADETVLIDQTPPKSRGVGRESTAFGDATQILDETHDEGSFTPALYISSSTITGNRSATSDITLDATQILEEDNVPSPVLVVPVLPSSGRDSASHETEKLNAAVILDKAEHKTSVRSGDVNVVKKLDVESVMQDEDDIEFEPQCVSTQVDEEAADDITSPVLSLHSKVLQKQQVVVDEALKKPTISVRAKRDRTSKAADLPIASPPKKNNSAQKAFPSGIGKLRDGDDMACTQAYDEEADCASTQAYELDDMESTQPYSDEVTTPKKLNESKYVSAVQKSAGRRRGRPTKNGKNVSLDLDEKSPLTEDVVKPEPKRGRGRGKPKSEPENLSVVGKRGRGAKTTEEMPPDKEECTAVTQSKTVMIGKGKGRGKGKSRMMTTVSPQLPSADNEATQAYTDEGLDGTSSLAEIPKTDESREEMPFLTLSMRKGKKKAKYHPEPVAEESAVKSWTRGRKADNIDVDVEMNNSKGSLELSKSMVRGKGKVIKSEPIEPGQTDTEDAPIVKVGLRNRRGRKTASVADKTAAVVETAIGPLRGKIDHNVKTEVKEVVKDKKGRHRLSTTNVTVSATILSQDTVKTRKRVMPDQLKVEPNVDEVSKAPNVRKVRGRVSKAAMESTGEELANLNTSGPSNTKRGKMTVKTEEPESDKETEATAHVEMASSHRGRKRKSSAAPVEVQPEPAKSSWTGRNRRNTTQETRVNTLPDVNEDSSNEEQASGQTLRRNQEKKDSDLNVAVSPPKRGRSKSSRSNSSDILRESTANASQTRRRTDQTPPELDVSSVKGRDGRGKKEVKTNDLSVTIVAARTSSRGHSSSQLEPMPEEQTKQKGSKRGKKTNEAKSNQTECGTSKTRPQRHSPSLPTTPTRNQTGRDAMLDSPSLRRRTLELRPKVMFTGVVDSKGEKIVTSLGGTLETSIYECTHLIADKVRRTMKFLCCVARGIPIVTNTWLDRCKDAGIFINAAPFLVQDKPSEKLYRFKLSTSLRTAAESRLLEGYRIHVTKSVVPEAKQMKDIIQSAGGEFLVRLPTKAQDKTMIVSSPKDQAVCKAAIAASVPIVDAEFLLSGILRQVADIKKHQL